MLGMDYNIEQNSLLLNRREYRALAVSVSVPVVKSGYKHTHEIIMNLVNNKISYSINNPEVIERSFSQLDKEKDRVVEELKDSPFNIVSGDEFNFIITQARHIDEEWVCVMRVDGDVFKNSHVYVPISEAERASEIIKSMID